MINKNKFGKCLKKYRLAEGLTLKTLSIGTALSISALSHLEHGRRGCKIETLQKILDYLNLPTSDVEKLMKAYHAQKEYIYINLKKYTRKQRVIAHQFAAKMREVLQDD